MKSALGYVGYAVAAAGVVVLAWFLGSVLHLQGASLWIFRGAIFLLGVLLIAGVWLWLRFRQSRQPNAAADGSAAAGATGAEGAAGPADIDRLIREAEIKVSASRLGHGLKLSALPAFFLLGETGSGKTTDVVNSGLDPELLAGQIYQESAVVPTPVANLWFARKNIFVEAGGRLVAESKPWQRLVQKLAPGKLSSIFGRKNRAPRAAIVCVDCEKIGKAKDGETIAASARTLRARLEEMSHQLGASVPVYVFFNRTDRLPFFEDFAARLTNDEATQVLGITLPYAPVQQTGVYAEQETRRLTEVFNSLFFSLADCRPGLLARENSAQKLSGSYEFPRQFRKLGRPAVQFLVELCRPSHLRAGPFLRGFYFVGMRMVVPAASSAPTMIATKTVIQPSPSISASATSILTPEQMAASTPVADWDAVTLGPGAGESRLAPQYVFLTHIFSHVLLQDHAALGASAASTKVSFWRRALLATGAAIGVILILAFLISFFGNHSLESDVVDAAHAIQFSPVASGQLASLDSLKNLDALRSSLARLSRYQEQGAPLHLRWGLYSGDETLRAGRAVYFRRFQQLLFAQTQEAMRQSLALLPSTPGQGDAYSPAYNTLKAYLITTSNPDKAACDFLTPVLTEKWSGGQTVDEARSQLAQQQFDFYCSQLKYGNPYSSHNDASAVAHARLYLGQFGATQRIYQAMLAGAAKSNPAFNFSRSFPDASKVVRDTHEVPGAFTKSGWAFMQDALAHSDRYFSGEEWVLGSQSSQTIDRVKLASDLQTMYQQDFISQWQAFLKTATVVRYAGPADAAQKLEQQAGIQSPLLILFCQVSQNTQVLAKDPTNPFQPVQAVVSPQCASQYIQPANQPYINALLQLQGCVSQIATAPNPQAADQAKGNCTNTVNQAKVAASVISQGFKIDPAGHTERTVLQLLQDPIVAIDALLRPAGPGNADDLCAQFRAMHSEFPFDPSSTRFAGLDEINAFFAPGSGALSQLYQTKLANLLIPEGARYIPKPSSPVRVNPAFLRFFNDASETQQALYPAGAKQPQYSYSLQPYPSQGIQELTLQIDGRSYTYKGGTGAPMSFVWPGAASQGVTLAAKFSGGSQLNLLHFNGLWAVFQFFAAASHVDQTGSVWRVQWSPTTSGQPMTLPSGQPVVVQFDVSTNGAPFLFRRGYLSGLSCVARITQ